MPKTKKIQIDSTRIGKEEINFPEFPLGIVSLQQPKIATDKLEFKDLIGNDEIKVTVLPSALGYPNQHTRDLLRALMRITWKKNNFKSSAVQTSIREILRELGLSASGQNLETIKKNLRILAGTRIEYEKSFFDKSLSERIKTTFNTGIISSFVFEEIEMKEQKAELKKKGDSIDFLKSGIFWNQQFFEISLKDSRNLIDYDYTYYITLKHYLAKELYLLLNKRSYNKSIFKIELNILAFEKLGISRTLENKMFKVRQMLKKAHKELKDTGFIQTDPVFKKENGIEYVTYFFLSQQSLFENNDHTYTPIITPTLIGDDYDEIKTSLVELGFTEGEVGKVLKTYDQERIRKITKLYSKQKQVRNPKKWIFKALLEDFDTTEIDLEEDKQKQELEAVRLAQEEKTAQLQAQIEGQKRDELVDTWISNNPEDYKLLCEAALKDLELSNVAMYILLRKSAFTKKIEPLEAFLSSRVFNAPVRSAIAKDYLNI
jgi:Replication initiator protein A